MFQSDVFDYDRYGMHEPPVSTPMREPTPVEPPRREIPKPVRPPKRALRRWFRCLPHSAMAAEHGDRPLRQGRPSGHIVITDSELYCTAKLGIPRYIQYLQQHKWGLYSVISVNSISELLLLHHVMFSLLWLDSL